jgi:GNAT superfamily N-acetyltransferase
MANASLVVKPVQDKNGINDFLRVPFAIYANDPLWVAPLFLERKDHLNPKKNPYFQHADAQLFVAYRDGKAVGRISAQDDRLRKQYHDDGVGQFGFFECHDDNEVASALFSTAAQWLRARGFNKMQGPFSFSINDEIGVLIDGFDKPANMMMGHAVPYYDRLIKAQGLDKAKDVLAYFTDNDKALSPVLLRILKRANASSDVTVRPLDLKNLKPDIKIIMQLFNDAWSSNWGFVPFTDAELAKLSTDLKMLVKDDFGAIAYVKGEPAAFTVTLPNLNEWITGFQGSLLPFNWAKLAARVLAKKPRTVRMPLMGVAKKYQDGPLGSTLALMVINAIREAHIKRGVKGCEMSWILEDNMPVRHIIETVGATAYKTYRVYEKAI